MALNFTKLLGCQARVKLVLAPKSSFLLERGKLKSSVG